MLNNVGLILLEQPFTISRDTPHIGVACIAHRMPQANSNCETMGWGLEDFKKADAYAVILKKVFFFNFLEFQILNKTFICFTDYCFTGCNLTCNNFQAVVRLVNRNKCQNALRGTRLGTRFQLHQSLTCAGGQAGVDACRGDGGSPLVCPIGVSNISSYST